MALTTRDILLARLPRTEGRTTKPYKDTEGNWTVGVGHNISAKGLPAAAVVELIEKGCISDASVQSILDLDIKEALKNCQMIVVFNGLDEPRKSVLADMVFNMGVNSVLGFVNTLMYIGRGDWKSASAQMLNSKWAEQVGSRAIELAGIINSGEIKSAKSVV